VLEQCKESALSRLEEIHNQRELAVMETLEDIDLAQVPQLMETLEQCCGSGSGIRCLFDPWIPNPYF
jgi:hypothetical protein